MSSGSPERATQRNGPLPSQNKGRIYSGTNPGISTAPRQPASDARAIDINPKECRSIQRSGEWLRAAHATHATADNKLARKVTLKVAVCHRGKCFERTLDDPLCADVDPTAGRHLAIHHQS